MTDGGQPPRSQSPGQRLRTLFVEYPEAVAIGVYAVLAIAAFCAAYFAIFSVFAPYDDEGTLLVGVDAFAHGGTLYRDIWSVYGPFYYELFGGLFALTGHAVSTDASRTIVIFIWVGTSLLFGLAAQRLTGRLVLGATAMIAAFGALNVLANEPMHPQGLCVLLLASLALVAVFGLTGRSKAWTGAAFGALLAALVLTKVNLGAFAVAAVVLSAALSAEPLARRGWIRSPIIIAFLAMPLVVLDRDLDLSWVRELLVLEVLAAVALIVAARRMRPQPGEDDGGLNRWLLTALAGFVFAFVAIIVAIVLTGPSLSDVYDGIVTKALQIRDILEGQVPFPPGAAMDWAIIAVAAAALCSRRWRPTASAPSIWPGLLRAFAGVLIWMAIAHIVPVGLNPSSANPMVVPMLLAWVVAIPPTGLEPGPRMRFLRLLLPLMAIAETLQVYPVPGSQLGIGSVFFVTVGALCLGDALFELRAWSEASAKGIRGELAAPTTAAAGLAVAAIFALNVIVMPAATSAVSYNEAPKLHLSGAELLHLGPAQEEEYERLVALLHKHHCTTFIGFPNVNSLYLWSHLEPPPPVAPNAWMYGIDAAEQQRAVDALRASSRPCAIRNESLAQPYLKGLPPPQTPLVQYIFNDFRRVATVGNSEFMLPKPSATGG